MANLAGTAQQVYISLQCYLGPPDYTHETLIDYVSPTTLTGIVPQTMPYILAPSASYTSVILATWFPAVANAIFLCILDQTVPGQPFGVSTSSATGSVQIAASSFWTYMPNGGTLPTVYLSNPSGSTASLLQIMCLSN
jgi:hypothetical protein